MTKDAFSTFGNVVKEGRNLSTNIARPKLLFAVSESPARHCGPHASARKYRRAVRQHAAISPKTFARLRQ